MILFVDLDEVFCDFVSGALYVHGWSHEQLEENRKPGQWNMADIMGVTEDQFWYKIHEREPDFWLRLRTTPWARDLMILLEPYHWYIVSSPSRNPDCHSAKIRWCRRVFPDRPDPIITKHKYLFAQADRVLIDDCDSNVEQFVEYGGKGIVFPTTGNSQYKRKNDPLTYLKEQLNALNVQKCE